MTVLDFFNKCRDAEFTECAGAQMHFLELGAGWPTPRSPKLISRRRARFLFEDEHEDEDEDDCQRRYLPEHEFQTLAGWRSHLD